MEELVAVVTEDTGLAPKRVALFSLGTLAAYRAIRAAISVRISVRCYDCTWDLSTALIGFLCALSSYLLHAVSLGVVCACMYVCMYGCMDGWMHACMYAYGVLVLGADLVSDADDSDTRLACRVQVHPVPASVHGPSRR